MAYREIQQDGYQHNHDHTNSFPPFLFKKDIKAMVDKYEENYAQMTLLRGTKQRISHVITQATQKINLFKLGFQQYRCPAQLCLTFIKMFEV